MARLPVITGIGGINPAGRVSFHHSYRRTVIDKLPLKDSNETYASLAALMGVLEDSSLDSSKKYINDNTLVRRIQIFDPESIACHSHASIKTKNGKPLEFILTKRQVPENLPKGWILEDLADGEVKVTLPSSSELLFPNTRSSLVTSAGQVPTGFDPGSLYQSRSHPRGLQLTVFAASDAARSTGLDWEGLRKIVRPDEFAVYSGSAMGQLDTDGSGGMLQAPMMGKRATARQAALGLCEMPADFINAYILGSLGSTGAVIGACATFLYNLKQGIDGIRSGQTRVAMVGGAEAPITPEIIEGYRTMGALADDATLRELDSAEYVDNRRACRPFSSNAGFTLSEAAVYVVLMDDELALETGAEIYGSVGDVFINADGFKKSIPSPGVGNYLTMGKAISLARSIGGDSMVRDRSYIHAHGTGTPQNRVTESHIMNEMAKTFHIEKWTVAAIKSYLGHTLAPAAGDQLSSALGTWKYGIVPGISTIDHVAEDVHDSNLDISPEHKEIDSQQTDVAFINSKGFGGNNATGLILSPTVTRQMLRARHGSKKLQTHDVRHEKIAETAYDYDQESSKANVPPIYHFGEGVLEGTDLTLTTDEIRVPGFEEPISLKLDNPYEDMT